MSNYASSSLTWLNKRCVVLNNWIEINLKPRKCVRRKWKLTVFSHVNALPMWYLANDLSLELIDVQTHLPKYRAVIQRLPTKLAVSCLWSKSYNFPESRRYIYGPVGTHTTWLWRLFYFCTHNRVLIGPHAFDTTVWLIRCEVCSIIVLVRHAEFTCRLWLECKVRHSFAARMVHDCVLLWGKVYVVLRPGSFDCYVDL